MTIVHEKTPPVNQPHSLIENVTGHSPVPSNENVTQEGEQNDDRRGNDD